MQRLRFACHRDLLSAVLSIAIAACSSPTATNGGTGGDKASGGTPGSGGEPATGGVNGTGGRTGSGGATGSGGQTVGTGGRSGSGGATGGTTGSGGQAGGTGGRVGSGGTTGPGGQTGSGGAAAGGTTVGGQPGSGGTSAPGGAPGRDAGRDVTSGSGGRGDGGASGTGGGGAAVDGGGGGGDPVKSAGCGKTPTLKKSGSSNFTPNTLSVGGTSREYVIRWPDNYDNSHAYRLHFTLHGYGGSYSETAGNYFGLWSLSNNTTIFIALSAISTDWRTGDNVAYAEAVLKAVEADLCIDTSRVTAEGFSQGAAMTWTLACSLPGVFRAAVGHSGGGVTNPTKCDPIPYFGSGGLQESVTQTTQTDQFAKWDGCTIETFAKAPTGGHACYDYKGCSAGHPVRWCNYDGPHTPSPNDSGKSSSWMPSEVWPFITQF
jgi:poly(3-hydroxybutyrate) depolymerase